jgi:hypothetical protein
MRSFVSYLIARFREPSTYAAFAALLAAVGLHLDPGVMQNITLIGTGIAGMLGIVLRDGVSDA